jgi:hypothetical protein
VVDDLGPPLKAATESEIWGEVFARYNGVFAIVTKDVKGRQKQEDRYLFYSGGYATAYGLAAIGYARMKEKVLTAQIEDDG